MRIIDIHAHIFPEKIAVKAAVSIGDFYGIPMKGDGTAGTLLKLGEEAGIDRFVVHSVATGKSQVESINDFIAKACRLHPDKFVGFATFHPDCGPSQKEIARVVGLGLRGVKIHPDFQRFNVDSEAAFDLYESIEGRLPLLVHTGDYRYEYSKPARILNVIRRFPKLNIICAHFGGWSEWESAAKLLAGNRIWVDTSSSLYTISPEKAAQLIDLFGADRVLFGTDYPMWTPAAELERFNKIELTEEVREMILHKNAEALLGI